MNYTLDCEFNGYQGDLMSLSLQREDGASIYCAIAVDDTNYREIQRTYSEWMREHVVPHWLKIPQGASLVNIGSLTSVQRTVEKFLQGDSNIQIHTDWPDDVKYFCELLLTGPGTMLDVSGISFKVHRVESYPTNLSGVIRHHSWWDALVLMVHLRTQGLIQAAAAA